VKKDPQHNPEPAPLPLEQTAHTELLRVGLKLAVALAIAVALAASLNHLLAQVPGGPL